MYFVNQNVINQSDNDFENQISPQTLLSGNITSVSTKDSNDKFYISDYEQTFSNHSDNVSLITTQPDLYTTPISSFRQLTFNIPSTQYKAISYSLVQQSIPESTDSSDVTPTTSETNDSSNTSPPVPVLLM